MTPTRRRLHVALPIIALQLGCSTATLTPEPVPSTRTPQVMQQDTATPAVGEGWTSEVHMNDGIGDAHQHPDPDIPDTVLEAPLDTAEGFLAAWLTDDQHLRRHLLTGIAAPTLRRRPLQNRRRLAARANPRAVCDPAPGHHPPPPGHRRRRRPHTHPRPCQPVRLDRHQGHRALITPSHRLTRVQTTVTTSQHDDSCPWNMGAHCGCTCGPAHHRNPLPSDWTRTRARHCWPTTETTARLNPEGPSAGRSKTSTATQTLKHSSSAGCTHLLQRHDPSPSPFHRRTPCAGGMHGGWHGLHISADRVV